MGKALMAAEVFEETDSGTCGYAIGCGRAASFTKNDVRYCRTCKVQASMSIQKAEVREAKAAAAKLTAVEPEDVPPGECGCACGGRPKGGVFLPGHDAKLKARRKKERK